MEILRKEKRSSAVVAARKKITWAGKLVINVY